MLKLAFYSSYMFLVCKLGHKVENIDKKLSKCLIAAVELDQSD